MKSSLIFPVFAIVAGANLVAGFFELEQLNLYTKPLLMPILIYLLISEAEGVITLPRLLFGIGLVFSWGGDVLLLYESEEIYFLAGLGCFLIAQLIYAFTFYRSTFAAIKLKWRPIFPMLIYGMVLISLVGAYSGNLLPAIIVYGLCILTMASVAILRKDLTSDESYRLILTGALLFVISDSVLAINKFVFDVPISQVVIMATYISAQYYLLKGMLAHSG